MACLLLRRSLREASCCSVEVVKGAAGLRVYGFSSTRVTVNSACSSPSASARAEAASRTATSALLTWPRSSKSRPVATRAPSRVVSRALKRCRSPGAVKVAETLA